MALFNNKNAGGKMFESSDVVTVIGPEAYFHGVLTVRGSVRVEGEVEGNVTDAHSVIVGKGGKVRGDVCAEVVVNGGEITGDVVASEHLELKSGGRISGDIRTPRLLIEEGAVFDGHCAMSEAPASGKKGSKEKDKDREAQAAS